MDENKVRYSGFRFISFLTDKRGAVVTGKITEYQGESPLAYFRTIVESETEKNVLLHFSTLDELALWINGRFIGYIYRNGYGPRGNRDWNAWFDFWENPGHKGRKAFIRLKPGLNQIVIRIRNGQYASGGFFVHLKDYQNE